MRCHLQHDVLSLYPFNPTIRTTWLPPPSPPADIKKRFRRAAPTPRGMIVVDKSPAGTPKDLCCVIYLFLGGALTSKCNISSLNGNLLLDLNNIKGRRVLRILSSVAVKQRYRLKLKINNNYVTRTKKTLRNLASV